MLCAIWSHLCNFKKRKKDPWRNGTFGKFTFAKFGDDPLAQHSIIISTILLLKFVSVHFVSGKDISISYTWRYPSSILRTVKTCRFDNLALN